MINCLFFVDINTLLGTELPVELISTLIKMAPTQEEELKLRLYNADLALLGPADRFLKVLVEVPFVYKRLEALFFMGSLHEDSSPVKDAFATLEVKYHLFNYLIPFILFITFLNNQNLPNTQQHKKLLITEYIFIQYHIRFLITKLSFSQCILVKKK